MEQMKEKPWEVLRELLEQDQAQSLEEFLGTLDSNETVRAVFRLSHDEQRKLLLTISPQSAAEIIEDVPESHAVELLDELEPSEAASIVNEMASDDQADLLGEMDEEDLEQILQHMDSEDAADARHLITYEDDTAGGLMMTEFISYPDNIRIKAVIDDLSTRPEDYALYNVQYLYVVGRSGKLRGVLRLRDLVFGDPERRVSQVMMSPEAVDADTSMEELGEFFDDHEMSAVPVVDKLNKMVGVVRRRAVYDALAEKAEEDNLKARGIVGGEELRSMPMLTRSRRRLSWLSVNVLLNILAASVIAYFQDTLSAVIALAVFLPIVSDMSGCSGNQAVAVSMRELTLGVVHPADAMRVLMREIPVGVLNGIALGGLVALAGWIWKGNPWLGVVVGSALALNTVVAVSIGGTVPLVLKAFKIDPALASGPVLTTITDMCGFFLVLGIASLMLPRLVG
jgi:magnesium transporter